jgi:hypothetical protein
MTTTVGALYSGECLLSRLAGQTEEAFILACLADRRIRRTTLSRLSGYPTRTLRWLIRAIEVGDTPMTAKKAVTTRDVHQALVIYAAKVQKQTVGHEGFGLLANEIQTCETGRCDEVMREVQAAFNSRDISATDIAKRLDKCRHWFYVQKQAAMMECQTPTKCENWELILNAFRN